jgi:hypothetical protein
LAKPNYSFEKRQRELAKKKKQEEKRLKKAARQETGGAAGTQASGAPDGAGPPAQPSSGDASRG